MVAPLCRQYIRAEDFAGHNVGEQARRTKHVVDAETLWQHRGGPAAIVVADSARASISPAQMVEEADRKGCTWQAASSSLSARFTLQHLTWLKARAEARAPTPAPRRPPWRMHISCCARGFCAMRGGAAPG
ncbi:hypothetical protein ACK3TF_001498 [Chlorella vulgaris]